MKAIKGRLVAGRLVREELFARCSSQWVVFLVDRLQGHRASLDAKPRPGCVIGPGEKRRELAQAINVCRLFHNQPKCVLATAVALELRSLLSQELPDIPAGMGQLAPLGVSNLVFGDFFLCFLPQPFPRDLMSLLLFGLVVVRLKFGVGDETVSGLGWWRWADR